MLIGVGMTLLVGFDSAWTPGNSGAIAGLLQDDGGAFQEIDLPHVVDYAEAERLVDAILERDPFREGAHRLKMRIAGAVGDEDRVITAYRHCERALGELGIGPSSSTRQLLETLRR